MGIYDEKKRDLAALRKQLKALQTEDKRLDMDITQLLAHLKLLIQARAKLTLAIIAKQGKTTTWTQEDIENYIEMSTTLETIESMEHFMQLSTEQQAEMAEKDGAQLIEIVTTRDPPKGTLTDIGQSRQ